MIIIKILLVYPPFPLGQGMGAVLCSPPLNMLTLAGAVPEQEIDILDLNVDNSYGIKKMEEKLRNYDLIGVTCMSGLFRIAIKICKLAKKNGKQTIIGGFHPTLDPSVIDKFDCFDMLVRGEGEITFKEILSGKPKNEILGLSYRENGTVHHNPDRPFVKNLDDLPFPRNELVDSSPYQYLWTPAWVCESSRGCPFKCEFCCVTKFYKRSYRTKTPERVIKELFRVPTGTKFVFFVDDNFTMNKKRVMRICELLQKTHLNEHLVFGCQSRADDIANNPEMVSEMHKSGFVCIFFGFESFSQMALDHMKKGYTIDKVKKSIDSCHENGIMVFGSFIIGNIGETKEDIRKTFKLMKDLDIDFIMTMPLTPFPGTELYNEAMENGWLDKEFKWENRKSGESKPIMRSPDLTINEIQKLVSESYSSFYKDTRFLYRKYLSKNRTFDNPNFSWTRPFVFSFVKNAITKFVLKLDKIIEDVDVSE